MNDNEHLRQFLICAAYESEEKGIWFDNFVVGRDVFPSRLAVENLCRERRQSGIVKFKGICSIVELHIGEARGWK